MVTHNIPMSILIDTSSNAMMHHFVSSFVEVTYGESLVHYLGLSLMCLHNFGEL